MTERRVPRVPPPPLEGPRLEKHFRAMWQILWSKAQLAGGMSPVTVGTTREFFVREFLSSHLPSTLTTTTGHILFEDTASPQMDILIFRNSGLALPMGDVSIVFPESLVACMEVKSELRRDDLLAQIAPNFRALPQPQPFKVVVALRLEHEHQHRGIVGKWACDAQLEPAALPDLIIILDNAAIIRGRALRCLGSAGLADTDERTLYKLGSYQDQKWLGLMLLVFELAQRVGGIDWSPYVNDIASQADFAALACD